MNQFFSKFLPVAWFYLLIGVAFIWMKAIPSEGGGIELSYQNSLTGFRFEKIPLTESERAILRPTEYLNGVFKNDSGAIITAFAAEWDSETTGISPLQHTPDICWINAGWKHAPEFKKRTILIPVSDLNTSEELKIPFEMRVFKTASSSRMELVVWCTLIGGVVVEETPFNFTTSEQFPEITENESSTSILGTSMALRRFAMLVSKKLPADGDKQFIRFSCQIESSLESAEKNLLDFAKVWLTRQSI